MVGASLGIFLPISVDGRGGVAINDKNGNRLSNMNLVKITNKDSFLPKE